MLITTFAHEVYVLTPQQITEGNSDVSTNVLNALSSPHNLRLLLGYSLISLVVLGLLLLFKSRPQVQKLGKTIDKATIIAPDIIRIAFGASLIFSALHGAIFGPELPLSNFPLSGVFRIGLLVIGIAITLGLFTRVFAWLAILVWVAVLVRTGWYALTYVNYLGEAIAVALLPIQLLTVDSLLARIKNKKSRKLKYQQYSMPIARLLFGFSLLYAAINVKFAAPMLTLDVVNNYHLTSYFPFEPLFIVLGAFLVECLIALLFMAGLLRRVNAVVFLVFLIASLLFFKEAVWPHYILIATAIGIFLHKPDKWALDTYLFNGKK